MGSTQSTWDSSLESQVELTEKVTFNMFLRRASALAARLGRGRNLHNIPKEKIEGDYQVWVGYLRKPPPAVTGFDIPAWAPYAGWLGIAVFMWIWASGPVLRNRELRREVVGKYIYPRLKSVSARPSRS